MGEHIIGVGEQQALAIPLIGKARAIRLGGLLALAVVALMVLLSVQGTALAHAEGTLPVAVTEEATEVGETEPGGISITMHGKVTLYGASTEIYFEYGEEAGKYEYKTVAEHVSGAEGSETKSSYKVIGLLPGVNYHFRIVARNGAGTAYGKDLIACRWKFTSKFGSEGVGNGQLKGPRGVAVDSSGDTWVTDSSNNRVEEFSPTGEYIRKFGERGPWDGDFEYPYGIAVDPEGHVWVTDSNNFRVQEFSSTGSFIREVGSRGSGNGQFAYPTGIAIDSKGNVWVVDSPNHRVEEFSKAGAYLGQFGGESVLKQPVGIAIDPTGSGDILVTDYGNERVDEFSSLGTFLRSINTGSSPYGVTVTPNDRVLVSRAGSDDVREYTKSGELVMWFGSEGTGNGQFELPAFMAMNSGKLVVADSNNSRVQEFESPNS